MTSASCRCSRPDKQPKETRKSSSPCTGALVPRLPSCTRWEDIAVNQNPAGVPRAEWIALRFPGLRGGDQVQEHNAMPGWIGSCLVRQLLVRDQHRCPVWDNTLTIGDDGIE